MERQSKSNLPEQSTPRGIRFPEDLRLRLVELAADTQRTFSDMVIHLVRRGLQAADQDEADRRTGERLRRQREHP
jgi:hypothetical protein